jgi:succinate dehydrogenase / fumarate reductase iron-sulfur subunit
LFDRPGGPSPFGEDVTFPLPVERLAYSHPEPYSTSS